MARATRPPRELGNRATALEGGGWDLVEYDFHIALWDPGSLRLCLSLTAPASEPLAVWLVCVDPAAFGITTPEELERRFVHPLLDCDAGRTQTVPSLTGRIEPLAPPTTGTPPDAGESLVRFRLVRCTRLAYPLPESVCTLV